jgi:hypothetical protein
VKFLQIVLIVVSLAFGIISMVAWMMYGITWLFYFVIPFVILTCLEIIGEGLFNDPETQEDRLYAEYDSK